MVPAVRKRREHGAQLLERALLLPVEEHAQQRSQPVEGSVDPGRETSASRAIASIDTAP